MDNILEMKSTTYNWLRVCSLNNMKEKNSLMHQQMLTKGNVMFFYQTNERNSALLFLHFNQKYKFAKC